MTIIRLECPQCKHQDAYDNENIDMSKEVACSGCGFSGLPTSFELPKSNEPKGWQITKIVLAALAGAVLLFFGIYVIAALALAALFPPLILAPLIGIVLYRRWKAKKAKL